MSSKDFGSTFTAYRPISTEKTVWHTAVSEETTRGSNVQLTITLTAIYEEFHWESGFCVGHKDARGDERELGVSRDGLLDTLPPELSCNGQVVFSSSKTVAEANQLIRKETQ